METWQVTPQPTCSIRRVACQVEYQQRESMIINYMNFCHYCLSSVRSPHLFLVDCCHGQSEQIFLACALFWDRKLLVWSFWSRLQSQATSVSGCFLLVNRVLGAIICFLRNKQWKVELWEKNYFWLIDWLVPEAADDNLAKLVDKFFGRTRVVKHNNGTLDI